MFCCVTARFFKNYLPNLKIQIPYMLKLVLPAIEEKHFIVKNISKKKTKKLFIRCNEQNECVNTQVSNVSFTKFLRK